MTLDLRRITLTLVASLIAIRFWIEIITTTVFKNANLINAINGSSWFHHYQLGILVIIVSLVWKKLSKKYLVASDFLLAFGIALFADQYVFILSIIGLRLPYDYRSTSDYLVVGIVALLLVIYSLLRKKPKLI